MNEKEIYLPPAITTKIGEIKTQNDLEMLSGQKESGSFYFDITLFIPPIAGQPSISSPTFQPRFIANTGSLQTYDVLSYPPNIIPLFLGEIYLDQQRKIAKCQAHPLIIMDDVVEILAIKKLFSSINPSLLSRNVELEISHSGVKETRTWHYLPELVSLQPNFNSL